MTRIIVAAVLVAAAVWLVAFHREMRAERLRRECDEREKANRNVDDYIAWLEDEYGRS
jgi:hypothetical protein